MTNSETGIVSIILPTHNSASFISEAIESVLLQSYSCWELLICDDGSTDNTFQVVKPYLKDLRIRYLPMEKQPSVYRVRNLGIAQANGEYIAFLDADDAYYPDHLEKLVNSLQRNPEKEWAYNFYTCINETGQTIPNQGVSLVNHSDGSLSIPVTSSHTWENILKGRCVSILQTCLLRRSFMEKTGPFYEKATHAFDVQYLYRLFLQDMKAAYALPFYGVHYRIHAKGITKSSKLVEGLIESRLQVAHWLYEQRNLPEELLALKPYFYLITYLRIARLQLFEGRPCMTFKVSFDALRDKNVLKIPCIINFLPLVVLACLPTGLYRFIFNMAKSSLNLYGKLMTRVMKPSFTSAGSIVI